MISRLGVELVHKIAIVVGVAEVDRVVDRVMATFELSTPVWLLELFLFHHLRLSLLADLTQEGLF